MDRVPLRRHARVIRARQEIAKRIDAVLPRPHWSGVGSVITLLDPAVAAATPGGAPLRARFGPVADRPSFPALERRRRSADSLPARGRLLEEAEGLLRGEWTVFGTPIRFDPLAIDWLAHPLSRRRGDAGPWHTVAYSDGWGGDVKHLWELNRHAPILRLAQAYHLTGRSEFAARAVGHLTAWISQNPPGRGINWASSLEVAFRAVTWCWVWRLTREAECWTDAAVSQFLWQLWHHARHVERFDSVHHSPNTHFTGEAVGLLYVGLLFPEFRRATRWVRHAERVLESELGYQVLADGMHFERATGYHRYTVEFYLHYLLLARALGRVPSRCILAKLPAMLASTAALRRPDQSWPVIGDEDSGDMLRLAPTTPNDQRFLLALGAALFDRPDWRGGLDDGALAAAWWLLDDEQWGKLATMEPAGPAERAAAFPDAGYYVAREHWRGDAWYCLVDAGPHVGGATGHAHTDLGHVEIARGGIHLVTDPGCPTYTADRAERDWFRSESAHACLVVEGAPLAAPAGPFAWSRVAPTPRVAWGDDGSLWWCDLVYDRAGRCGPLTHRRQVVLVRGWGVVVCDWVHASGETVSLHWPSPVEGAILTDDDQVLRCADLSIMWRAASAASLRASLERVELSPAYGERQPGQLLVVRCQPPLPAALVTAFADADRAIRLLESGRAMAECELTARDTVTRLTLRAGAAPASRSCAPFSSATGGPL